MASNSQKKHARTTRANTAAAASAATAQLHEHLEDVPPDDDPGPPASSESLGSHPAHPGQTSPNKTPTLYSQVLSAGRGSTSEIPEVVGHENTVVSSSGTSARLRSDDELDHIRRAQHELDVKRDYMNTLVQMIQEMAVDTIDPSLSLEQQLMLKLSEPKYEHARCTPPIEGPRIKREPVSPALPRSASNGAYHDTPVYDAEVREALSGQTRPNESEEELRARLLLQANSLETGASNVMAAADEAHRVVKGKTPVGSLNVDEVVNKYRIFARGFCDDEDRRGSARLRGQASPVPDHDAARKAKKGSPATRNSDRLHSDARDGRRKPRADREAAPHHPAGLLNGGGVAVDHNDDELLSGASARNARVRVEVADDSFSTPFAPYLQAPYTGISSRTSRGRRAPVRERETRSPFDVGPLDDPSAQRHAGYASFRESNLGRLSNMVLDTVGRATNLPALKGIKVNGPTAYRGEDNVEAFLSWASAVLRVCAVGRVTGPQFEHDRILILSTYLSGDAIIWFEQEVMDPDRIRLTWTTEDLMHGLYNRFINSANVRAPVEGFENARYDRTRGVISFARELEHYSRRMPYAPSDFEMITRFMLFLPKKMKKHLTLDKNVSAEMSDWEAVKEFAIEYETGYQYYQRLKDNPSSSAYQLARESGPPPQPRAHRDESSRYQHDRGMTENRLAADVPRTVKDTTSTEPDIPAVQSSIPAEPPRHDSMNDRRPRRDQNDSGENGPRCYACQRLGHIRSDPICPNYSRVKERFSAMQVLDEDVVMKDTSAQPGDVAQDTGSSETDSEPQSFKDVGSQHESEGSSEAFWSDSDSDSSSEDERPLMEQRRQALTRR